MKKIFALLALSSALYSCTQEHPCGEAPQILHNDPIVYAPNNSGNEFFTTDVTVTYNNPTNSNTAKFYFYEVMTDGSEQLRKIVSVPSASTGNLTFHVSTINLNFKARIKGYSNPQSACDPSVYDLCPPNPEVLGVSYLVLGESGAVYFTDFELTYRNVAVYNSNDTGRRPFFIMNEIMEDGSEVFRGKTSAFYTGDNQSMSTTNFSKMRLSRQNFRVVLIGYQYEGNDCTPSRYFITHITSGMRTKKVLNEPLK